MGIFGALKSIAASANEDAHANRIAKEHDDTVNRIFSLEKNMTNEILRRFSLKREDLRVEAVNWSRDGQISIAKQIREKARQTFDLNVTDGYVLFLLSAWLESGARSAHPKCHRIWMDLSDNFSL